MFLGLGSKLKSSWVYRSALAPAFNAGEGTPLYDWTFSTTTVAHYLLEADSSVGMVYQGSGGTTLVVRPTLFTPTPADHPINGAAAQLLVAVPGSFSAGAVSMVGASITFTLGYRLEGGHGTADIDGTYADLLYSDEILRRGVRLVNGDIKELLDAELNTGVQILVMMDDGSIKERGYAGEGTPLYVSGPVLKEIVAGERIED